MEQDELHVLERKAQGKVSEESNLYKSFDSTFAILRRAGEEESERRRRETHGNG
jgi:hypothetical protein